MAAVTTAAWVAVEKAMITFVFETEFIGLKRSQTNAAAVISDSSYLAYFPSL
jgi:hypothetical protein